MVLLFIIIFLALVFDYINGFHDAANSIATVVSTRVLTPLQAVIWAAFFNFVAFFLAKFLLGFKIANTLAKTIRPEFIDNTLVLHVILAAFIAAIIWNLITWWFGIPSSSSHTLIGSIAGAAIVAFGFSSIHYTGHDGVFIIIIFIFAAPFIGIFAGAVVTLLTLHIAKNTKPKDADHRFRRLQLISSAALSIMHGLNDSQKVMGVIGMTLIAYNLSVDPETLPHWLQLSDVKEIHDWVPFACFTAIALGTMSGGWKIMKTMGNKITKLTPVEGFCSQTAAAITLQLTAELGIPVSTTHVITGSIMGVGAVKRLSAVRWGITIQLLWAWILTIPVSAILAALIFLLIRFLGG